MTALLLKVLLSYLLGSLVGSLVIRRFTGVDIRSHGSGNAGATNALRTQGKLFALLVLAIDIAKGMFAVWWLPAAVLPQVGIDPELPRQWLTVACGCAVIAGRLSAD